MAQSSHRRGTRIGFVGKARRFWAWSADWRKAYGTLAGLRLAVDLRGDYARPPGTRYSVHLPGLRHPLGLRAASADAEIFMQLCRGGDLRIPLSQAPEYILDAGANIGVASAILASRFPAARILAVEPKPGNFASLKHNTAPYPRVIPLESAVWGRDGMLELSDTLPGSEHTVQARPLREPTARSGAARRVEAWSISSLLARMAWPRFDLVKLDIEGGELEVLRDGELGWLDTLSILVVELHDRFRPGCRESFDAALLGRGFEVFRSGEYHVAQRLRAAAGVPL